MNRLILAGIAAALASPALAQGAATGVAPGAPPGTVIQRDRDNTGSTSNVTIAPGPTGASTIQSDSAAAGNAGHPSRAVPQGSGGSSGGGSQ